MNQDAPHHPELVPRAVRVAVVDAVGGWGIYKVREIADLFLNEGFGRQAEYVGVGGGQRRQEAEAFQVTVDFTDPGQVERYLRVVETILEDHNNEDGQEVRLRLLKVLARAEIVPDAKGRLSIPGRPPLHLAVDDLPNESGIRLQVARLARLEQEPEEMIGAAKELVEATIKHVLRETGEEIPDNADLPALSKRALSKLKLHPGAIAPTTKGSEVMVRILGGLAQTAAGLAELRNLGYGTGHGQDRRIVGIRRRHAEFAARSAIAYVTFVLDTHNDPDAPWRRVEKSWRDEGARAS
jgi:Abortive infection C-terminus